MRKIKYIVVHCTATKEGAKVRDILKYWRKKKSWSKPGYHYVVKRDGEVRQLLDEKQIANGVKGFNGNSIHIAWMGGLDKKGKLVDNRTKLQNAALFDKLVELAEKYDEIQFVGHRDMAGVKKSCPLFDVKRWLCSYVPDLGMAA